MTEPDLLTEIQQALDETGVWIAPAAAAEFSPEEVSELTEQVAAMPTPTYVVVQPLSEGDEFGGDPIELVTQLHDRSGEPGLYLAPAFYGDLGNVNLQSRTWGPGPDPWRAVQVAEHRHSEELHGPIDDVGAMMVDVVTLLATDTAEEAYAEEVEPALEEYRAEESTPPAAEDGGGGVLPTVSVVGGLVILAAAAAAWWTRRRERARVLRLPASVVANVQAAHVERLTQRARADVLALGEAIDAADLTRGDDTDAWQAALDHYDVGQRVLERGGGRPDLLDVVGAIVLARRGTAALAAAQAGRAFQPEQPCYLNPLHGGPTRPAKVESGGRTADAPLCSACRTALKAGRAPDVLDVERRGRVVHYFETDAEPWTSTGYGALHGDLVERLHRLP